jgi:peroxiredoxin
MKWKTTIVVSTAIFMLFGMAMPVLAGADPEIGKAALAFSGTDSSGDSVKLSDFRGKIVVLEWSNHDCPYVRKHYGTGNMQSLQKKWTQRGVVWLTIISSAPGKQGHVTGEEADDLTVSRGASPTAVILDPEGTIGRRYKARTTPHMFVIDSDGILVYMGGIDDKTSSSWSTVEGATNYVDAALRAVEDGEQPAVPVARPYGCSVKY